jgi:hypothetical protein
MDQGRKEMNDLLQQAMKALKVDVPVLDWYVRQRKDGQPPLVTLLLYGGQVKTWSPPAIEAGKMMIKPSQKRLKHEAHKGGTKEHEECLIE